MIPPGSAIEEELQRLFMKIINSTEEMKRLRDEVARIQEEREQDRKRAKKKLEQERKKRERTERELERVEKEREMEQYPRTPDRMAGAFAPGITGALIPTENKVYKRTRISWITLRSTQKIKERSINWLLPLDDTAKIHNILAWLDTASTNEEVKDQVKNLLKGLDQDGIKRLANEHQAKASREMAKLLHPRGLCLHRALQREYSLSVKDGTYHEKPGLGVDFFCSEERILNILYPGPRSKRTEHVEEFNQIMNRMTSELMDVQAVHLIQDGKNTIKIKTSGRLYQKIKEVEVTRIPEGKREEAETQRGVWIHISEEAMNLFNYGNTKWHAWGDPVFLSMSVARTKPKAVLVQDWIDEQLNIGWSQYQGKQAWTLNNILDDLALKNQYLYPDGDPSKEPWPVYRRNDWLRKLLKELLWTYNSKSERGLWETALIQDPDTKNNHYKTIPNFIDWLKTPEGKQSLKKKKTNHKGEPIVGALRYMFQVEIGPEHKLNNRIKITDGERGQRNAAKKRKTRAKK